MKLLASRDIPVPNLKYASSLPTSSRGRDQHSCHLFRVVIRSSPCSKSIQTLSPTCPVNMPPLTRLATARSRMFGKSQDLQTPEPQEQTVPDQPPSPPRQRFRLKRRNAPQMNTAPTQQFLESVAAADVPIPSIEEPPTCNSDANMMHDNNASTPGGVDPMDVSDMTIDSIRPFSPPKTPAPIIPSLVMSPQQFPDWHASPFGGMESSPDCDDSRPSTARSTLTSASIFSRYSIHSDMSDYESPIIEQKSSFGDFLSPEDANATIRAPIAPTKSRKARWTKPMSDHLWFTYLVYLQDPKVTPIRIGKSAIPPQGVILRVAREARRSWKGSFGPSMVASQGGSITPTMNEPPRAFIQWPHTDGATRAHLRDLCRANAGSTTRTFRYMANSPTPGGRFGSRRGRYSTPARSSSVFSSSDMAMSLTLSTSDTMHAQGPLAQLAGSGMQAPIDDELPPLPVGNRFATPVSGFGGIVPASPPRLGSPFVAKSYGPSSSSSLAGTFGIDVSTQQQNLTVGARRIPKTPAKAERSRSNTQSRRPRQAKMELRRNRRPSLASDMWNEPTTQSVGAHATETSSAFDSVFLGQGNDHRLAEALQPSFPSMSATAMANTQTRLGSPFSVPSSFSLPGRFFRSRGLDFGSADQAASIDTLDGDGGSTSASRSSFPFRLSYLDQRLRDLRRRDDRDFL